MLVRRCSDAAQQHQREQRDERMWMPHPIERVKRDAMAGTSGVLSRVESVVVYVSTVPPLPSTFPRQTQCSARRAGERQSRSSPGFLNFWWRFFGSSKRPPEVSEDPKTHQVAHWWWRFFGSSGKKTIGGSVSNAFPPSDGLTKRPKCVSAAAASSGFARVQDRAATW